MPKSLVIVESPAKAKTIKKYLGSKYSVKASVGHVIDLPTKKLGVDVENGFKPEYEVIKGKKKVLDEIVAAAKTSDTVFLAPDPDREGEAIAWHIAEEIRAKCKKSCPDIHRVLFHEITKSAVQSALKDPQKLDKKLFEAQQARRILDRLVGYKISPLLWKNVRMGLSAGRVQSVAVRIVCEREAEIKKFKAEEYWSVVTKLEGSAKPAFEAKLAKVSGEKPKISNDKEAGKIVGDLKKEKFTLTSVNRQERRRHPVPPFITSKLQQEAARKLGYSAKKTMMLAQQLYEGVELADGETVGLITYMRTDSVRVAASAIEEVREYIVEKYGKKNLPDSANVYKTKKSAQDAHEAIRPTLMKNTPEAVEASLSKDQLRLYELIWKRFVASQMLPAIYDQTTFEIKAGLYELRATGSVLKFAGFMEVYLEGVDEEAAKDEEENASLPNLKDGELLKLREVIPNQHFTEPPPRFTEASLVKTLEELGIGRPSTYASIMSTIQDKKYVEKREGRFYPTRLGDVVNEILVKSFPEILDVKFTAQMEGELDDIEEGKLEWKQALEDFYKPFAKTLKKASSEMTDIKKKEISTELMCEKCGNPMVIKWGRHGEFLACSKYPECKNTKDFKQSAEGDIKVVKEETTDEVCPKCGAPMTIKRGRFGKFLACTKYPECKTTKAISIGIKCPLCDGPLVERRSKKGKVFYGCSTYPKCTFASWQKPVNEKCPECGGAYLVEVFKKDGPPGIKCPQKGCPYKKES